MNYASSCSFSSKRRFKNFQNRFLNDVACYKKIRNGRKTLLYFGFIQNAWFTKWNVIPFSLDSWF